MAKLSQADYFTDVLEQLSQPGLELPNWVRQNSQSVTYARAFVDAACEYGAKRSTLLRLAQVSSAQLMDPAGRVSLLEIVRVIAAALATSETACLGVAAGSRMPITAHGSLGYALMCSSTPRDAITLLERFWRLRGRGATLNVVEDDASLLLEVATKISPSTPLSHVMQAAIVTSMYKGLTFLLPRLPHVTEIWLRQPPPVGHQSWQELLPLRFDMPCNGVSLRGDMRLLEQLLPTANPEALEWALAQCERESALLEAPSNIAKQVRGQLLVEAGGYPAPAVLAQRLHLTQRTLRRRLHEEGVSYQQLLLAARRRDSCRLLADETLKIGYIGELLGYRETANFTRAFKSWYGVTPSYWRRQQHR